MDFVRHTEVETGQYRAEFRLLSPDFLFMQREIDHPEETTMVDVFANRWLFFLAQIAPGELALTVQGQDLTAGGVVACFVPPFSILHWKIGPGKKQFHAYHSTSRLPTDMPKVACVLPLPNWPEIRGTQDIFATVRACSLRIPVDVGDSGSDLARKARRWIERWYREPRSLSEMAAELDVHHSVLARAFKNCYGLNLIDYRNRLRVDDSLHLIQTQDVSSTEAGIQVGFENNNRFYFQFKRVHQARPSQFRLSH